MLNSLCRFKHTIIGLSYSRRDKWN